MKQKAFFVIFKGLSLIEVNEIFSFLESESPTLKQVIETYKKNRAVNFPKILRNVLRKITIDLLYF